MNAIESGSESGFESYFDIGKIVNTQGLGGEVRVLPVTDEPGRFTLLGEVWLFTKKNENHVRRIERVRFHKQFVILKFEGVDTIDDAEKLRNAVIKIPPEKALPLGADEYYIRDLYGIRVFTEEGEELGEVTDVIPTGANDVYAVTNAAGETLLIPAVKSCVLAVDVAGRTMRVRLLEGLR